MRLPRLSPSRGPRRPIVVLLAVLALVVTACGSEPSDPNERLAEAFRETFDAPFSYRFVVEADREALDGLGQGAGQAAAFLSGFAVEGVVHDDTASARVKGLGTDLMEMRAVGEEQLYVRLGVQDLLALLGGGGFAAEDVVPALESMGVSPELRAAVLDLLTGKWVGIEGGFDPASLGALAGGEDQQVDDEEAREAFEDAFGEDIPTFFERFVEVVGEPSDEEGVDNYQVLLQLREILRAASEMNEELGVSDDLSREDLEADLAELPATVPGEVSVTDGVVTSIAFRIAETVRDSGTELTGDLDLIVDFSQHGEVEPVAAPEDATVVSAEAVEELFAQLSQMAESRGFDVPSSDG